MPIVRSKDAKRRRRRMAYINGSKPFHYYNEWDAKTAAWLRELIRRGHLPDGIVDERSITEVAPEDLRGFRQWHFFAGIGGWPLALKLAGWPADAPVCTGSPPCQPFSVAGKRGGRDDSRHLAPAFLDLIAELRPPAIFGEQVSAAIKELWLDALFVELEDEGYACGSAVLPACSVGAPHKRDRLFFGAIDLADLVSDGLERRLRGWADKEWQIIRRPAGRGGAAGDLSNAADGTGLAGVEGAAIGELPEGHGEVYAFPRLPDQDHGPWSEADWLGCRDGKFRPVEPGTFPLVDGVPARVVRLRGYGNAIVPSVGCEFIKGFMRGIEDMQLL
ncbi:cytosine methylase [Klebsiella phage Seifer]|uniref:Cytosine methylase n=1 Tax=Klebsiella phage Seifer TaxID=2315475 RepID=A0A3B8DHY0_9CAUD|nr:cytosine methylase [Klebsiella phage Seifer]AYJ72834.1 cytosine methylase [Klebsiella phage Seifer]